MRNLTALLLAMAFVTGCAATSSSRQPPPLTASAPATAGPTTSTSPVSPTTGTMAVTQAPIATTTAPNAPAPSTVTTNAPPPSATTVLSASVPSALLARMATEPVGLARQALEAETTVRNSNATAEDRRSAGEQQQLVYRILARHQDWEEAFFAQISADVEPFARNNYNAAKAPLDPALSKPVPRKDTLAGLVDS